MLRTSIGFAIVGVILAPTLALGIGLHGDEGRFSYFLRAPNYIQFDGRLTRTDAQTHKSALYSLSANFPFKSRFLGQLDLSFASLATNDDIEDGITDLMFRTRFLIAGPLLGTALLRTGSGTNLVFPYSSGTVDLEVGLAVLDTATVFDAEHPTTWWLSASGGRVIRGTRSLDQFLQDYLKGGFGVVQRVWQRFDFEAGVFGYWYEDGPTRQVVFGQTEFLYSDVIAFFLSLQADVGEREDRPNDASGTVGLRVRY